MRTNLMILITLWLIGQSIAIQAQQLERPLNIQSPNASSLGRYGDVPVSYYTGTPNISIPIHTLNVKGVELNVTLNFDASGIRLDDHPGWVGQNWSIDAGGVVTRTVRGQPDELSSVGTGTGTNIDYGFLYQHGSLSESSVDTESDLKNIAHAVLDSLYDYTPDIFTFNFMGKTGKFFMDNDGNWKVLSDANLRIEVEDSLFVPLDITCFPYSNVKYPKVIGGIRITDDQGTTYEFGYQKNAIEYSIDFFGQGYPPTSSWKSNAWYLTKVTDKYGNILYNLTYTRGNYFARFYWNIGSVIWGYDGSGFRDESCFNASAPHPSIIGGELIYPSYLSSISTPNKSSAISFECQISNELKYSPLDLEYTIGTIISRFCSGGCGTQYPFYYIGNPKSTTEVINSFKWFELVRINAPGKCVNFIYNNDSIQRLYLQRLDIYGKDFYTNPATAEKHSYTFRYKNYQSLPGYLSKKVDHWGYYRGGNDYTIPSNLSTYSDQRQANGNYSILGLLDTIYYPTGGYTKFIFKPNTYSKISNESGTGLITESGIGSGVRIDTIKDYDGKQTQVRSFKYVLNYPSNHSSTVSSGILTRKPRYFWDNWVLKSEAGNTLTQDIFSVNSIVPLSNVYGATLGYSEVVETRSDNSYSLYKYSNYGINGSYYDDPVFSTLNVAPSPYDNVSDLSMMRGKLLCSEIYNNNNSLVQKKSYTYRTDKNSLASNTQYYVIACDATLLNNCENASITYHGSAYKMYFFDYDEVQEDITDYLDVGSVTRTINYSKSDNNIGGSNVRLTSSVAEIGSDGLMSNTVYFYPHDFQSEPNMSCLIDSFRIGEVIETTKYKDYDPVGATRLTYKVQNNLCVPASLLASSTSLSGLQTEITYDTYDNTGNLVQYTPKDGTKSSIIWGYQNTLPIVTVSNACYQPTILRGMPVLSFESAYGEPGTYLFDQNDVSNLKVGSVATISVESCFIPPNVLNPQTVSFYLVIGNTLYQEQLSANESVDIPITVNDFRYLALVKDNPNIIVTGTFKFETETPSATVSEVYYEGFEERSFSTLCNTAKTGNYIWGGTFSVPLNMVIPGSYKLSYWTSTDKITWTWHEQDLTVYSGGGTFSIGGSGTYVDEVRLFPKNNSQLNTYTYDPLIGMTSKTDANGVTTYYEYDDSNRLKAIRNNDRSIVKTFNYNYK